MTHKIDLLSAILINIQDNVQSTRIQRHALA